MNIYSSEQIYRAGATSGGTLGGFFTFGGSSVFGISNNHVLANMNNCQVGDPVYRTGSQTRLGTLQYWIELDATRNYLDVALFKIDPVLHPTWVMPPGVVQPGGIREVVNGEPVYLMRNNGSLKTGTVTDLYINYLLPLRLGGQDFPFTGLVEVAADGGHPFSVPGESGSIIFSAGHEALGILLGTSKDTTKSYFVPFIHGEAGICYKYNISLWRP